MTEPTAEQKTQTLSIFKNIVNLLEHGMFLGLHSRYVAESTGFLKANIEAIEKELPAATEPLHAVPAEVAP